MYVVRRENSKQIQELKYCPIQADPKRAEQFWKNRNEGWKWKNVFLAKDIVRKVEIAVDMMLKIVYFLKKSREEKSNKQE